MQNCTEKSDTIPSLHQASTGPGMLRALASSSIRPRMLHETCIKNLPSRDAPCTCKHKVHLFRNSRLACKLYCLHLAFSAQHWLLESIVNSTVHRKGPQLLKSCVVFHSCPERLVGHLFHHSYWTFSSSLTCHIK